MEAVEVRSELSDKTDLKLRKPEKCSFSVNLYESVKEPIHTGMGQRLITFQLIKLVKDSKTIYVAK